MSDESPRRRSNRDMKAPERLLATGSPSTNRTGGWGAKTPKAGVAQATKRSPSMKIHQVPDQTVLCSFRSIAPFLDGIACDEVACDGRRKIFEVSTRGFGGCAEVNLRCNRCADEFVWLSGTPYWFPGDDYRSTRYMEMDGLMLSTLLAGKQYRGYADFCSGPGLEGGS